MDLNLHEMEYLAVGMKEYLMKGLGINPLKLNMDWPSMQMICSFLLLTSKNSGGHVAATEPELDERAGHRGEAQAVLLQPVPRRLRCPCRRRVRCQEARACSRPEGGDKGGRGTTLESMHRNRSTTSR